MPTGALDAMEVLTGLEATGRGSAATSAAFACEKLTPANTSHSCTPFSAASSSRSLYFPKGSKFSFTVPANQIGDV